MSERPHVRRPFIRRGRYAILLFFLACAPLRGDEPAFRVVILGSSTAEGAAASPLSNSWANLFTAWLSSTVPGSEVVNLAVGGFSTFNIMPTGSTGPAPWDTPMYAPVDGHNITAALALDPDLIIINLPSNDGALYVPVDMQMHNYATILAAASAQNVPVWISTSQPRNVDLAGRTILIATFDASFEAFGGHTFDFWTGLAADNGTILPEYDADGTHLNNAGHAILFERVISTIDLTPPAGPAVAMHPRARAVSEGDTTSFSVVARSASPLTYQWQRDGVDIPGAADPFYPITAALVADSGTIYRCIVSDGMETDTSNGAILSVQRLDVPPASSLVSDDFFSGSLNPAVWSFEDPLGDASFGFTGTGTDDVWLSIVVPGGVSHDLWTGTHAAPRIMQTALDEDFEVEVKFASAPSSTYQMQGLLVAQDTENFIRFDIVRKVTRTYIFAASFTNGEATVRQDSVVTGTAPGYLRLRRTGDVWSGSVSVDGETWVNVVSFSHGMAPAAVGPFAGNHGIPTGATPAFTAHVDYFFNTAAPIDPEDAYPAPDPPVPALPLSSSGGHDGTVEMVWTSGGNEGDSLQIVVDTLAWESPLIAERIPPEAGTYQLTAPARGVTYYWRVLTIHNGIPSGWSATSWFSTAPRSMALAGGTSGAARTIYPDTSWADVWSDPALDWAPAGARPVPVFMSASEDITFSACTLAVRWDPVRLGWRGVETGGMVLASAAGIDVTVDSVAGIMLMIATCADTLTASASSGPLLRIDLASRRPGGAAITIDHASFSGPVGSLTTAITGSADTIRTLILPGDVSASGGNGHTGDGRVDFNDLSAWSFSYWSTYEGSAPESDGYKRKFDVGPTEDGSPWSTPVPDGTIGFDDLMVMALVFGATGEPSLARPDRPETGTVTLEAGTPRPDGPWTAIPVVLRGSVAGIRGLSVTIPGFSGKVKPGTGLRSSNPAALFFHRTVDGGMDLDIAAPTATGGSIPPDEEIFVLLQSEGDAPAVIPEVVEARDGHNRPILLTTAPAEANAVPTAYALEQNYPNPFNPATTIRFALPVPSSVTLRVYSILGAEVATLTTGTRTAGVHDVPFDASGLPSGVYLCRMQAEPSGPAGAAGGPGASGAFSAVIRLILLR